MTGENALNSGVDASVVSLVDIAIHERLSICAGAGISRTAGLPDGRELARRLHARFDGNVSGYKCDKPDDLLAVAAAAAAVRGGLEAVQRVVLELAPFGRAAPQPEHLLLALMVAEGAVRLLLTNWDNCVERSWRQDDELPVARNAVEVEELRGQFILKIHGCCTEVKTLLITPDQLKAPGLWTETHFASELTQSTMVFVGIGDIADYAQETIKQLADLVNHARVRVVSPGIDRDWVGGADEHRVGGWKKLLPDLPEERRLPMTAEVFFDQLAREWVMTMIRKVNSTASVGLRDAFSAVEAAVVQFTAADAVKWLRRAAVGWGVGESVVRSAAAETAMEAIAVLTSQDHADAPSFTRTSSFLLGDRRIEVVLCQPRQLSSDIEAAALERARSVSARTGPQPELTVLISAASIRGRLRHTVEAANVVDPDAPIDGLIDGPASVSVNLLFADELLRSA